MRQKVSMSVWFHAISIELMIERSKIAACAFAHLDTRTKLYLPDANGAFRVVNAMDALS